MRTKEPNYKPILNVFLLLAITLFPTVVWAQTPGNFVYLPLIAKPLTVDATLPQSLEISPTSRAASVVSQYADDENGNNLATVYYREAGTKTWVTGPLMSKDVAAKEWRGSLVSLAPDTAYELEVRYEDSDGVSPAVLSGSFHTLADDPDVGGGGRIFTVPTDGSLTTAINQAEPGDTIQLLAGVYYESVVLDDENSGAPGQYITIEPAPGATVAFDGSYSSLNAAGDNWTFYATSTKGDIYYTDLPFGETSACGSNTLPGYVGQLFNNERVRYLLFDSADDWNADFLPAPAGKAYYVCSSSGLEPVRRLYVVTLSGDDPDNQEMHVSQLARGIYLRGADYIRIRGFQFRHYGWSALQIGNSNESGADYNLIEDNTFHGMGEEHIRINGKDGQEWTIHNLIQNNQFSENGYRDRGWEWSVAYNKGRAEISNVLLGFTGPGNVIRGNSFMSGHDGIRINRESDNVDVYNNTISECMDDGIEIDNEPGQNIRVWGNTINYCYVAISLQDWNNSNPGPVYIFRNVLRGGDDPKNRTDHLGGTEGYTTYTTFKVGSDQTPTGAVYIYHNTISLIQSTNSGDGIRDAGGSYFANVVSRNNIWNVTGRVFYFNSPNSTLNHDFDCDNMHDLHPDDDKFVRWGRGAEYPNLATFQAQTNQELHGMSNSATSFDSNLHLLAGSPDIDAGCLLPGFNDSYNGAAPDLGAFEFSP